MSALAVGQSASKAFNGIGLLISWMIIAGAALLVGIAARPYAASALPSFARQTGQPCGACHTGFPQLTPYGREFKLRGYTAGGGFDARFGEPGWVPPLSAQLIGSFTHTGAPQDNTGIDISPNNNTIFQEASVWYGGAITDHIGMMFQGDYINPITPGFGMAKHQFNWDMLDLRYANTASVGNLDVAYGATLNNQIGIQDVWNSVPAWSFPFVASTLAPTPAARTLIEGAFTQRVLGLGAYAWINSFLYLEASGYQTLSPNVQDSLGIDPTGAPGTINQIAPYFRAALERTQGNHSLEFGGFAFLSNVNPQPWNFAGINPLTGLAAGKDRYTDIGIDSQYQYNGGKYWITLRGSYIHENQQLNASSMLPIDPTGTFGSNPTNELNSFKASASFAYGTDHTVVLTGGYFKVWGTPDVALYGPGTMANSISSSPNSDGWIAEISYIPFGMSRSPIYPWFNARVGLQYIWYNKFNGATTNFDGMGTNAKDENTLFAYVQLTF
jgi:hypothetical protein